MYVTKRIQKHAQVCKSLQKGEGVQKKGKSPTYDRLLKDFDEKLEKAGESYIRKNVDNLKETNPSKAYAILKKLGAQPGDIEECDTFTLPAHENLSNLEAADKIAEHFSQISREFPPLNRDVLPDRVIEKIDNPEYESKVPEVSEYEVFERISKANKPKSGVPGDLPKTLVSEFAPELSAPVAKIFQKRQQIIKKQQTTK